MTLQKLLEKIGQLPASSLYLPVLGLVGPKGETFTVSYISVNKVPEEDGIGPIGEMDAGTQYVEIHLEN